MKDITVGELIKTLSELPADTPVLFSNDEDEGNDGKVFLQLL